MGVLEARVKEWIPIDSVLPYSLTSLWPRDVNETPTTTELYFSISQTLNSNVILSFAKGMVNVLGLQKLLWLSWQRGNYSFLHGRGASTIHKATSTDRGRESTYWNPSKGTLTVCSHHYLYNRHFFLVFKLNVPSTTYLDKIELRLKMVLITNLSCDKANNNSKAFKAFFSVSVLA